ncbi:MAG: Ig-like domain-containing protein [Geminicoccaceae bacterium]
MVSRLGDDAANTLRGDVGADTLRGEGGPDWLEGLDGADSLHGGYGTDSLFGGQGNDRLAGYAGADYLNGGTQDDVLIGGTGNDKLNGREGFDTAVFAGNFATYRFVLLPNGVRVIDTDAVANGDDGTDAVFKVETLAFRDRSIAVADLRNGGNRAPEALDDSATAVTGVARVLAVLANDRDPDDDPLTVTILADPAHGTCTVNADGTVTYRSADGYTGTDSFIYRISDGAGGTDTATVALQVVAAGGNAPPALSGVSGGGTFIQAGTALSAASGAAVLVDADMTVSDADLDAAGNYAGAVIRVLRDGGIDSADRFALATAGRSFTVVGSEVQVGGRTVATLDATAGQLTIAFSDDDGTRPGPALVDEILQSITWRSLVAPGASLTLPASVGIRVLFDDGSGSGTAGTSAVARIGIDSVLKGGNGIDVLTGSSRTDYVDGLGGDDTADGGNGNDVVAGGDGNDTLGGGEGTDRLFGGAGNDTLTGGNGSDVLSGGAGRDLLVADDGGGTLEGGADFDIFFTGAGRDIFVYRQGDSGIGHGNRDIINLFDVTDGDRLDLSLMDADLATAGDDRFVWIGQQAFSAPGQLRYYKLNDYWIVEGNNAGAGGTDFQIKLVQMVDPPSGEFFIF